MKKYLIVGTTIASLLAMQSVFIMAASTTLNETVSAGSNSFSADGSQSLTGGTSGLAAGNVTASFAIDPVVLASGDNWNVAATVSHVTAIHPVYTVSGSNTLTTGGTYDGTYGTTANGLAVRYDVAYESADNFKWRVDTGAGYGSWSAGIAIGTNVVVEKGITVTIPAITTGDNWVFGASSMGNNPTLAPGSPTADTGSTNRLTAGSEAAPGGTDTDASSASKTLLSADYFSIVDAAQSTGVTLSVPALSVPDAYAGTITTTLTQ